MRHLLLSRYFFPSLPRLVQARIAVCCSFFIQGFTFLSWGSRIPDIKIALGLDEAQLGLVLLMMPLGEFLSMMPGGWLINRWGSRKMLLAAGVLYPLTICLIGLFLSKTILSLGLLSAGAFANLSSLSANTQGVRLERLYKRSIIALFHGMWSIGGLTAVALNMLLARFAVSVQMHFALVFVLCISLLAFSGGNLMMTFPAAATDETKPKARFGGWKLTPALFWIGIAALGCMSCEGTVYDWAGVFMRESVGVVPAIQNYGLFAYLCTMVTMRFVADNLINRFGMRTVLLFSGLCISGGLAAVIAASALPVTAAPVGTMLGFAIVGIGTAPVVPLCCSMAGNLKNVIPSIGITIVSSIGFFGFLGGPPFVGAIAHATSLRHAFGIMAVIGLSVIAATLSLSRMRHSSIF